jgi:ribose transport system ATP-binding protein
MHDYIVELREISKTFGGVQALDNVTFRCNTGEVHTLVGQNGAGKSTLMKILAGVYLPDKGQVILEGAAVHFTSPYEAQKLGVSIIYQEFNLIPNLSVAANVFLLHRLGVDINPRIVVSSLSVAQQQMVEIAKALSLRAKVVIMDEPSATLGTKELDNLFKVVKALKKQGVAVIYISHRLEEVFNLADRVTVLKDGKLVDTLPIDKVNRSTLVQMMIGSTSFKEKFPPRPEEKKMGREIMIIDNLSSHPILSDINLTIHSGEIVGIAGLMGSGRTELAQVIFGVRHYDKGSITLENKKVHSLRPFFAIENGMSYVPEDRKEEGLVMNSSVLQNTALASMRHRQHAGFITKKDEYEQVKQVIEKLDVKTPGLGHEVARLSGGNQQKVVVAKWLLCNPALIIFDEPTRGIDVQAKVEIWKLIRELANRGAAVLMISSEIPEILGISDRIMVMHKGKIAKEFESEKATEEDILTIASFGGYVEHLK